MAVAIGASSLAHAAILVAALVLVRPTVVATPVFLLPVSLVSLPGSGTGGGGGGDAVPTPTPPAAAPEPALQAPAPAPAPHEPVRRKPVTKPKAAEASPPASAGAPAAGETTAGATAPTGAGTAGPGGSGSGPGGSGGASPAYGVNPQPPYPMAARRMGLEGTVVLRVVVAADGAPASVVVLQSSGHEVLDSSAVETVRARWRFVPARRNGVPVEDTVQVPIRFRQSTG